MDRIQCPICLENFSKEKRPMIICSNGHSMCDGCFNDIKLLAKQECSICREDLLPVAIVNRDVLELIAAIYETMAAIPVIKAEELNMESKPFGYGGSADVYRAQWNRQTVVIKRLRTGTSDPKQVSQLKGEISIHVGLRHPCIISLYGYTSNGNGNEIVMEYAERGSLNHNWKTADQAQLINWAIDIVDGLQYLHSRKISHRSQARKYSDCAGQPAKLSDFGMARVLATIQHNTSGSGTPKYTAPELLDAETRYGPEVDTYSVSLILYETFSGKVAFENLSPHQLLTAVYIHKKRPAFDSTFPGKLREKIERGWSHEAKDRCTLDDFLQVLLEMKNPSIAAVSNTPTLTKGETTHVSMVEQADSTQMRSLHHSAIIEMKWPAQDEQTKALIKKMIADMRQSSSFTRIFSETIISAMLQVPKHLFVDMNVYKSVTKNNDDNECLKTIYIPTQALRVSATQNMSSTEITCAQLSFIPMNSGDRVLFLGAKGGYIQTIAAQIVGFQGQVWICSQDDPGVKHVENILKDHVPTILRQIIQCVLVKDIQNVNEVKTALEGHIKPVEQYFDTIHVCGAVSQSSLEQFSQLLKIEGQLLAPIDIDKNSQKFTILHKTRDPISGTTTVNKRVLNDWGIIFGPVL